jgi:hypothetical protein
MSKRDETAEKGDNSIKRDKGKKMENEKMRQGPEARRAEAVDFEKACLNYKRCRREEMYWIL